MGDLLLGYTCCLIAGISFGVNYLPVKSCDIGDGIFFSAAMSVGILIVGLFTGMFLSSPEMELPTFEPLAAAGGVMFQLGNSMCPYIIKLIGLGLGLTIWDLSNMLMGWFTGYFGLFGMEKEHDVEIPAMNFVGLVLASVSLVFFSLASAFDGKTQPQDLAAKAKEDKAETDPEGRPGCGPSFGGETASNHPSHPSAANGDGGDGGGGDGDGKVDSMEQPRQSQCRFSAMLGFSMAVAAGLLFGATFDLPMDLKNGEFGEAHRHDILYYVFSHFLGIFFTAIASLVVYIAVKGKKSHMPGKLIFPSILSGLIWAVGMVAWFQANVELGYTVAFPIVGSLPGIIAIFIGLCFLGEMQTRRSRMCALIGMLLRVPGVLLIALSTY